jgi:drug/metabolite transporter (DMT)-like permease
MPLLGVVLALVGAVLLAFGAHFQNHGASRAGEEGGESDGEGTAKRFGPAQLRALLHEPQWRLGSGLLAAAIVLQLASLSLAPLAVVQPLGALSLVATAILDAKVNRARVPRKAVLAIVACVVGVTAFVVTASFTTSSGAADAAKELVVLALLAGVLVLFSLLFAVLHSRLGSLPLALGAGTLFGFVATLAKVTIGRVAAILSSGPRPDDWLVLLCLLGLALGGIAGLYLVQTAYAAGSPDLVVASLTVIDPLVAVSIGITVLGEAARAPWWAFPVFGVTEAVAVAGVLALARHQPQVEHSRA